MSIQGTLMILSLIIMGSFLYSYLLEKWFITPVLLLIATGMVLKLIIHYMGFAPVLPQNMLGVLGTIGLIVIVLEAAFDLKIVKENRRILLTSLVSAALTVVGTSLILTLLFQLILHVTWHQSLIYAIPLSIVSSAIIIPSVAGLTGATHQFIVLESIFSDIAGIVFFDYVLTFHHPLYSSLAFISSLGLMVLLSLCISIPLVYLISKNKRVNKSVFILAALVFVYALAKSHHLPALIVIVMFGLILNNMEMILNRLKLRNVIEHIIFHQELDKLRELTRDGSFLIRSLFFVFFGLSIDIQLMLEWRVLFTGLVILGIMYGLRWVVLTICLRRGVLLETFIAPRGLITILLYSQIPYTILNPDFRPGHVLFVIVISSIIMSLALFWQGKKTPLI